MKSPAILLNARGPCPRCNSYTYDTYTYDGYRGIRSGCSTCGFGQPMYRTVAPTRAAVSAQLAASAKTLTEAGNRLRESMERTSAGLRQQFKAMQKAQIRRDLLRATYPGLDEYKYGVALRALRDIADKETGNISPQETARLALEYLGEPRKKDGDNMRRTVKVTLPIPKDGEILTMHARDSTLHMRVSHTTPDSKRRFSKDAAVPLDNPDLDKETTYRLRDLFEQFREFMKNWRGE